MLSHRSAPKSVRRAIVFFICILSLHWARRCLPLLEASLFPFLTYLVCLFPACFTRPSEQPITLSHSPFVCKGW